MKNSKVTNCLNCKKRAQCFSKLIHSEITFLNKNKTHLLYRKGETICKQGAFASYLLYITDGLAKLYMESPNNKNINIKILKTADFIGFSSIYGDNVYHYSAVALKDSAVCLIEKESFKKLLENNGAFASDIIKRYCGNEKQLFAKIQSLSDKQMHGRLADTLLYLCDETLCNENIFSHLSRKDIADFAGLSTETTVRLLTELKNENIININGKHIDITNIEKLEEIGRRG